MGKVIGILSLKGGVGKTSAVAELGNAISNFNKKVLLVDGNLTAPNLGLHLNIIDPEKTLHDVLNGRANPRESIYRANNLDVMPSSMFQRAIVNPLKLRDKIKSLKRSYDFIILDSPPSINEETLAVMNASDELFIITTPDYPTLATTLKTAKMIKRRGIPLNGLIINKVYNKDFELSTEEIENTAEIPVLAVIPHDVHVLQALSKFKPMSEYKPNSEGSEEFRKLASVLVGEKEPVKLRGIFRWLSPKKQDVNRTIFYESVFGG